MRTMVAAAVGCLSLVSLSIASEVRAAIRQEINIPAGGLGPALQALSQEQRIHIVFISEDVHTLSTEGASGSLTVDEALDRLLAGTGLTYLYIDAETVTILPVAPTAMREASEKRTAARSLPGRFRVALAAEADQAASDGLSQFISLEEVIVTATKREASMRNVPVSVSALSGSTLAEMGAADFDDYAVKVPGLGFASAGPAGYRGNGPVMNIRGIGGTGAEPTTGFYIDETPLLSQNVKLIDLHHVEVLKGPQGTLYGARSYGGLVKVVTNKPRTDGFDANLSVTPSLTDGGGENWEFSGMLNLPLSDRLAARVVGYSVDNSGWIDSVPIRDAFGGVNLSEIAKDANSEDTHGGRLSLLWQASDRFDAQLNALYEEQAVDNVMLHDTWFTETYGGTGVLQNQLEPTRTRIANYNLTLNIHTSIMDITSSTSYLDVDTFNIEDRSAFGNIYMGLATDPNVLNPAVDGLIAAGVLPPGTTIATPLPVLDFFSTGSNDTRTATQDFTQEVRLLSTHEGPWQWLLGGFYQKHERTTRYSGEIPGIIEAGTLQLDIPGVGLTPFPLFSSESLINRHRLQETDERGVFAELTYAFAEGWQAIAGLRWFDTTSSQVLSDLSTSLFVPTVLPPTELAVSEDGLNPKFALSYKPAESALLFASVTKGFRIGGFTDTASTTPSAGCVNALAAFGVERGDAIPYTSDTLWTYELGAKTTWAGSKLAVNGTLFYNDWSDLQQALFIPACGTAIFQNAGKAVSQGVELEVDAALATGLTAGVAVSYMKSEITQSNVFGLAEGTAFTLAPDLKAAASLTYRRPLRRTDSRWSWFGRADFNYQDRTVFDFNNNIGSTQPSYSNLNLRLGLMSERLDVVAFAENVTDEDAILFDDSLANGFAVPLGTQNRRVRPARPPTFGVTFTVRY